MCGEFHFDVPSFEKPDPITVLIVTDAPEPPDWTSAAGTPARTCVARSLADAAERLGSLAVDVVVLDYRIAAADCSQISRFSERLGRSGLLVSGVEYTPETSVLLDRLGGAACLLPDNAPAAVQAQLVALAAERARLAGDLSDRVDELEERKEELQQSNARFRDIIERNADAILVVDGEGVIRFGNAMAADLFRSDPEELSGTAFGFPLVVGETTELDLLHQAQPRVVEMRVVESEWEGQTAYIASLRDITERKQAEEGARRLIREQEARRAAEASARRSRFLAEASAVLSEPLDHAVTLSTLASLCIGEVADWAVIYVVDEHGALERLEVAHRDPDKAEAVRSLREQPISMGGSHPVIEVLRTRSPLLIKTVDADRLASVAQDERHLELLRQLGVESLMLVPLVARDHELGAIALISSDPRRKFSEEDFAEANELALRAALAIDNARLYQEAQLANQAKSHLLAVISHDLRTPLNSIVGHADLLAMGIPDKLSDGSLQWVERIQVAASHLLYLIDELLSFARLDAGREELHLMEVDAKGIVDDVAAVVEPLALEKGLDFHLIVPAEPVAVRTDPDRLRQILLNLLGNAIKYTQNGEVRLELCPAAEHGLEFHVRDTGMGIPPEHLGRIFEPFWQVDPSQRGSNGGTGLGLSVVRGLAQLLGGEVTVDSAIERGSRFSIRLPMLPAE